MPLGEAGEAADAPLVAAMFELSPNNGEGELSMSTLIQKHMTNILAPLAERVMDLEERGLRHDAAAAAADDRAESVGSKLDLHDRRLATLSTDLARTTQDLLAASEGLGEYSERQAAFDKDHEFTRSLANRLESGLKDSNAVVLDLQRARDEFDNRLRELQRAVSETNIAHLNINDRMSELRNRHEGLNDRHLEVVKSVQETKQTDENTRQALKRFTSIFDKQRKEDGRAMATADDRIKNLEESVSDAQHKVELCAKTVKPMKKEVDRLKGSLDEVIGASRAANGGQPANLEQRLRKVEDVMINLNRLPSSDARGPTNTEGQQQALRDAISKNASDLARHGANFDNLAQIISSNTNRVQHNEGVLSEMGTRQEKLKEQVENNDKEVRSLAQSIQRDATNRIEAQALELAKTNTSLMQERQRVDTNTSTLFNLQTELGSTNGQLNKVGQSIDLAHEYFNGLSKGLQDTHKRVLAGQDGMLPPKTATPRRPLPVIAGGATPRPNSAVRSRQQQQQL